ncbi:MAG: hypothetical protein EA384_12635 [Spirochaetaceae bacterium]|nr:MAG: hypothetical protein EA384_12635 [Spirochaetaceae bacterium]
MRVLCIRLRNLNSLNGDHQIDLTAEPLASAGLYAITGATGAGKSTILDAVTLALYGRAARYGSRPHPHDVMSRHCGECHAEVEFRVPSGTYRALWQLRRARGRASGTLQPPQRYVYGVDGTPIAQKIQECERAIEDLIGLDYDRFLRSALLAQGEFARFLRAAPAERAGLLESLTGTAIYSDLGRLAHEQVRERRLQLERLEQELARIEVLDEAERTQTELELSAGSETRRQLKTRLEAATDMLNRISRLEETRQQRADLQQRRAQIEIERESHRAELQALARHRRTQPYLEPLTTLDAAEQQWKEGGSALGAAERRHAEATRLLRDADTALHRSIAEALTTAGQEFSEAQRLFETAETEVRNHRLWLDSHRKDALIAEQYAGLVASVGDVRTARSELSARWEAVRRQCAEAGGRRMQSHAKPARAALPADPLTILSRMLADAEADLRDVQTGLEQAERELRLRRDHLDKSRLIAGYEQHRALLEPGKECPLCGALEHPFADGTPPAVDTDELAAQVDAAESEARRQRSAVDRADGLLHRLQAERAPFSRSHREQRRCETQLAALLEPLEIAMPADGREAELLDLLQQRSRSVRMHADELTRAGEVRADAQRRRDAAAQTTERLTARLDSLAPVSAAPDEETVQPPRTIEQAETDYQQARREAATAAELLQSRTGDHRTARSRLDRLQAELEAQLTPSGFEDIQELRQARLPAAAAEAAEQLQRTLEQRSSEADALLRRVSQDIENLEQRQTLTGADAEEFRIQHGRLQEEYDELLQKLALLQRRLERDDQERNTRDKQRRQYVEQQHQLRVRALLDELIGSHDGSKFRTFAQSISLDILIRRSNRHLNQLSDRYHICRDESNQLGLQIEDLHQAAVRRPMESLSGGESFLVSLALALGLSDLAGRSVRIESLFIDEGFGSLDPETLDVAISALESLQQQHKTVGVISHVSLLKERISTQIVVEKRSGGTSRIRIVPYD